MRQHSAIVRIDGRDYELMTPEDFDVVEERRISQLVARLDPADPALDETVTALCEEILIAPDDVHDRLTNVQRVEILKAYLAELQARLRARDGIQ